MNIEKVKSLLRELIEEKTFELLYLEPNMFRAAEVRSDLHRLCAIEKEIKKVNK